MAFNTPIMTSIEVKDLAINDAAFDQSYFDNYLLPTQRKYLRDVIGKDFYNELLTEIASDTLTANNETLVDDFIKPMLAHYNVYEVYSIIHVQLSNQGSIINDPEYGAQAQSFDYSQSRDFYMNKADFWRKDMIVFIEDSNDADPTTYPLFDECKDIQQVNKKGIIFYD